MRSTIAAAALGVLWLGCLALAQRPTRPAHGSTSRAPSVQRTAEAPRWRFPDRRTVTEYPGP
jgi:hypothetical protein